MQRNPEFTPVSISHPDDTHGKALALNLDATTYGTFAEIGAGQEVARWFLSVGAASGTVAKTICAYDKNVSDEMYGAGTRYVSRERLEAMLDREYGLLLEQLGPKRGRDARFFAFADTVAARNYKGDNEQHGWIGIRFQTEPGGPPSQVLLHINLRDEAAPMQQQALGILGVNLVYASFHQRTNSETFLAGLFDDLSVERIEIDVIELDGPAFPNQDATAWCLALLTRRMSHAIVFDTAGRAVEPSSVLRKRPLLIMRGTFSNPELLDAALLESARRMLIAEGPFERDPVALMELSVHHVMRSRDVPADQMLACIRRLSSRGPLIATDYPETYLLGRYLRRHTTEPVRFVVSVAAATKIMHETYYQHLPGTLLEGLSRLLANNVKLYVAPMPQRIFESAMQDLPAIPTIESRNGLVTLDDVRPTEPISHLLAYLRSSGRLVTMQEAATSVTRDNNFSAQRI